MHLCEHQLVYQHKDCSLEYMTVPWEFAGVMLTAVYIPLDANAGSALGHLHDTISSQQGMYPEAVRIIAGDLKATLPKFQHHIKCVTTGANTLEMM